MDALELLLGGAQEDDDGSALIEALLGQSAAQQKERAGLKASAERQQGQAGGLRALSLVTSLGDNPLLRNVRQTAGEQGAQMESLAARTEQRMGGAKGVDPVALARLRQGQQRLETRGDLDKEKLELAKQNLARLQQQARNNAALAAQKATKSAAEDTRKEETGLRKELLQGEQGKKYLEAKTAYRSVEAYVSKPNAATDMALVFAAMKSLDPDSVVKEGEQVQVRNTTNIPGRLMNYFKKAGTGESFSQDQRLEIQEMARLGMEARGAALAELAEAYAPIAEAAGADMKRVMPLNLGKDKPAPKPAAQAPAPTAPAGKVRVTNGTETLEIDASDLADAQRDGYREVK